MKRFEIVADEYRKHPNVEIQLPKRATKNACAYDVCSPEAFTLIPGETHMVWTDVRAHIPDNYYLELNVRSGMGKPLIHLANVIGYIDADYYNNPKTGGNIGIMLHNFGTEPWPVNIGDRIAQAKLDTYEIMDDDDATAERTGGFGSTGKA